jgi:hypothetical protein
MSAALTLSDGQDINYQRRNVDTVHVEMSIYGLDSLVFFLCTVWSLFWEDISLIYLPMTKQVI